MSSDSDHPRANPIKSVPREAVAGAGVVLIAKPEDLADAILRLKQFGAEKIVPVNPASTDMDGDLEQALATLRVGSGGAKPPSTSLIRAARACAVPFPGDAFGALQPGVERLARLAGAPTEFVGGALLAAVSGIVGGRYFARVREGFDVPIINWIALVGDASSGKSPGMESVLRILRRVEGDYIRQHQAELERAEGEGKDCAKKTPPARRVIVSNASIEALHHVSAAQGRTMLCFYDELSEWFNLVLKYSRSATGDRGGWLSAHNALPLTVDRRGLGAQPLHIKCWGLSILGAIPPSVLGAVAATGELTCGDGLDVRLSYVYPSLPPVQLRPAPEDFGCEGQFEAVFRVLMGWRTQAADPVAIEFAPDARKKFETWRYELLTKARGASTEVDSWTGKLPGLVCRLAGALCCLDAAAVGSAPKEITLLQLRRAAQLADVLSAHRRRVELERGAPSVERLAAELGGFILAHGLRQIDTFEARRGFVPGIRSERALRQVLLELQAASWLDPRSYISPRADDPLPAEVSIRAEVFDLARKLN